MRSASQLLGAAWEICTSNLRTFALVSLVTTLVITVAMVAFGLEPQELEDENSMSAAEAVFVLFSIVVTLLTNIAIIKLLANPEVQDLQVLYKVALQKFLPYLWVTIILIVIVALGFILFIIPGIYLAFVFSFAGFAVILEGHHGLDALKQSRTYIKGRWFAVFGRYLFLVVIAGFVILGGSFLLGGYSSDISNSYIFSFVSGFVSIMVTCFVTAYSYSMYMDIKGLMNVTPVVAPTAQAVPETTVQ